MLFSDLCEMPLPQPVRAPPSPLSLVSIPSIHVYSLSHRCSLVYAAGTIISAIPFVFGVAMFCYEGIGVVLPLEGAMANSEKFTPVLFLVMAIVTMLFITSGTLGYLAFGDTTQVMGGGEAWVGMDGFRTERVVVNRGRGFSGSFVSPALMFVCHGYGFVFCGLDGTERIVLSAGMEFLRSSAARSVSQGIG